MKNSEEVQAKRAAYGQALLSNRGGWTLREILGADYENAFRAEAKPCSLERHRTSLRQSSERTRSSSAQKKKK